LRCTIFHQTIKKPEPPVIVQQLVQGNAPSLRFVEGTAHRWGICTIIWNIPHSYLYRCQYVWVKYFSNFVILLSAFPLGRVVGAAALGLELPHGQSIGISDSSAGSTPRRDQARSEM